MADEAPSDSATSVAAVTFPKPPTPPPVQTVDPATQERELAEELRNHCPPVLSDPPPPYPAHHHARRSRAGTARSARRLVQLSSTSATGDTSGHLIVIDTEALSPADDGTEITPLLSPVPRRRQRTVSHSTVMSTQSLAHTVLSLFQTDPEDEDAAVFVDEHAAAATAAPRSGWLRRYFRAVWKGTYYWPLLHLLLINFPFALVAFVYLFVMTLTGTTLLIALPLGAVICWLNLIGARAFARSEIALQTRFHGPLSIQPPSPPNPIFSRPNPTPTSIESGTTNGRAEPRSQSSFLRNTYAMFTDQTSYQALFYFLVIKPSITLFMTIGLLVIIPTTFVLILPAPATLRAVKRIGVWQANIALEGLSRPRL